MTVRSFFGKHTKERFCSHCPEPDIHPSDSQSMGKSMGLYNSGRGFAAEEEEREKTMMRNTLEIKNMEKQKKKISEHINLNVYY